MCDSRNLLTPSAPEIDAGLQESHEPPSSKRAPGPQAIILSPAGVQKILFQYIQFSHFFNNRSLLTQANCARVAPGRSRLTVPSSREELSVRKTSLQLPTSTNKNNARIPPKLEGDEPKTSTSARGTWRQIAVASVTQERLLAAPAAAGPAPRNFWVLPILKRRA